jgi:hypothetical protein
MTLRKFIIERGIPAVGSLEREQLRSAAAQSNGVFAPAWPRYSMGGELRRG